MGFERAPRAWGALLALLLAQAAAPEVCAQADPSEAGSTPPQEQPDQAQLAGQPVRPRLVLLQPEGAPARPALEPSLRIQLREVELVVVRAELPADVAARIATANRIAEDSGADWVVWADDLRTDLSKPADQAVLYVVGRKDGRALIEVVRVPGGEGPEVDRSLALKVHELVGENDAAAYALGNKPLPPPPAPDEQTSSDADPRAPERHVRLSIAAGAQASDEGSAGVVADFVLALAPSLRTRALVIAVPLELSIGLPRTSERDGARVEWSELGACARLKIGARLDPSVIIGGGLGGKLTFTDAEGESASGETGTSTESLPAFVASADAELALSDSLGAQLSAGVESRLRRQRFQIEGREIGDTGRTVLFVRLSLAYYAW